MRRARAWALLAALAVMTCSAPRRAFEETKEEPRPDAAVITAAPDLAVDAGAPCEPADPTDHFRCSTGGETRRKCDAGKLAFEACTRGCLRSAPDQDDVCMGTDATWSCPASFGTEKAANGDYYITAFGCWLDADGGTHADSADNCAPSCFTKAKAAGLCTATETAKACETRITWYMADAARFGCLARVKITNPANGVSVVAVALDNGPGCPVEATVKKAVLDTSGRIDRVLFGADQGASSKALVHVVEVDPSTPLGPQ